jgi:hypothetical protein
MVTEMLSFYCFGCQIIFHFVNNLRKRKRERKERKERKRIKEGIKEIE